jgi:hypothetical protein
VVGISDFWACLPDRKRRSRLRIPRGRGLARIVVGDDVFSPTICVSKKNGRAPMNSSHRAGFTHEVGMWTING